MTSTINTNKDSQKHKKDNNFNLYQHYRKIILFFALIISMSLFLIKQFGFNTGIEFSGGIIVETNCEKCEPASISKQISDKIHSSIIYQKIDNGYLFKTTATGDYNEILSTIGGVLKENNVKIVATDYVSPQITRTFINDSIFACLFAFICIGMYVMVRFNWRFSIAAILALMIDVFMVITFISVAQTEFCLMTLTAILTIIGYCINDKIVVFDKIRSNLTLNTTTVLEIIKQSVKSTLFRSMFTSLTTIIVATSLLFFGDRLIYELGIIVIIGIIFGTGSSIVLAPSLLLLFKIKHMQRIQPTKDPMWYAN